MRLFRETSTGEMLETNLSTAPDGLRVYAVQRADGHVATTALNLSLEHPIDLTLDHKLSGMRLIRLKALNAAAKTGETLGDARIEADGRWHANSHETASASLHLPPATAALIYS
jgi:hypothetical protein